MLKRESFFSTNMRTSKRVKRKSPSNMPSWKVLLILIAIPFTVLATQFPQTIRSSAQTVFSSPPVFFCLAMGESNKELCASSTLQAETTLQLNNYSFNDDKIVYYNDTLSGEASYTNTGDGPVTIKKIALVAESKKGNKRVEFNPNRQNVTVQPGKTVTVTTASRMFESPDPSGVWEVFSSVTLANGQTYDNPKKTIINVSAACTGLRAIPLDSADTIALKEHCATYATSKLCTSRQYCELTGGENCKQNAPRQPHLDKQLQCDDAIIIPEEEQGFLEEFCEANPDTATCKEFCGRVLDSEICSDGPDENVEPLPATATPSAQRATKAVAGAKILALGNTNCRKGQQTNKNTGECCLRQGPNLPSGQCPRAPGGAPAKGGGSTAGKCAAAGGSCKDISSCGGTVKRGLCPGGVNNICCVGGGKGGGGGGGGSAPRATCAGAGGSCKNVYSCGGTVKRGLCPGGASNICCVGGGKGPSTSAPVRACATGAVRLSNGRCFRDGSTPNVGPGYGKTAPKPAGPSQRETDCRNLESQKWRQCLDRCGSAQTSSCRGTCTSDSNARLKKCSQL
jgi:hypothetical protein